MAFNYINLPEDFTLEDISRLFFLQRRTDQVWAPLKDLDIRFLPRSARTVPESYQSVLGPGLGREHYRLIGQLIREQDEDSRPPPDGESATPTVRRRLPEFVRGGRLRAKPEERRQIVVDTLELLTAAARLMRQDPPPRDALAFNPLLAAHLQTIADRATHCREANRFDRASLEAFYALAEVDRRRAETRRDLAAARQERVNLLRILWDRDGVAIKAGVVKDAQIVIGYTSSPDFVPAARREAEARVVIQLPFTGYRILVVGEAAGLLAVAATLRNADAARRLGRPPPADAAICAAGRQAPPGTPAVFTLAPSGMAVGNVQSLDPDSPESVLSGEELLDCVLTTLRFETSPACAAVSDLEGRRVSTSALSAVCHRPERR